MAVVERIARQVRNKIVLMCDTVVCSSPLNKWLVGNVARKGGFTDHGRSIAILYTLSGQSHSTSICVSYQSDGVGIVPLQDSSTDSGYRAPRL